MATSICASRIVRGNPVEEERGAIRVLCLGCYAKGQWGRHGCIATTGLSRRHQEEPNISGQVRVVTGVLPVTVEGKDTLTLAEAGGSIRVLDGVDVSREVASLDPLLEMLGSDEVRRRIDRRASFSEDPVVDRPNRAIGGHQVLEREREPHTTLGAAPHHDWLEPGGLGCGEQILELSNRLGRLSHADLRCQLFVIEDTGQTVVEAHGIERARAADAIGVNTVLVELRHRPVVPSESSGVGVKVHEQPILGERDHRRQPEQIWRIVAREHKRRRSDQVRKLVLADIPGDVRVLLGELFSKLEGHIEAGLEGRP